MMCSPEHRGKFDIENKVRVYRFPSNNGKRSRWIKSVSRSNFPNKPDTVVYERHFLENF